MIASGIFAQAELDIFALLGSPVIFYSPVSGSPVTIQALISSSLQTQPSGMGSETWADHITVELLLSDFPDGGPSPGDTVEELVLVAGELVPSGIVKTLVAPLENNGHIIKWVVA
ncbi:MAG: hypothetical protein V1844_09895 [Pseudomonadota bacterium]